MNQMIDFPAGDKLARGYLAVPETGETFPAVLVLHAWWGLSDFFKGLCDRLAGQGVLALAPDLFAGPVVDTVAEAQELNKAIDPEGVRTIVLGALDALRSHPAAAPGGVGAIGFSFGAAWAIELSVMRPDEVAAVVLFYGVWEADFSQARAVYQGHFAEQDDWEPRESAEELEQALRNAGRAVDFYYYPRAGHWFFEENRPTDFRQEAAEQAWERVLRFLKFNLPVPAESLQPSQPSAVDREVTTSHAAPVPAAGSARSEGRDQLHTPRRAVEAEHGGQTMEPVKKLTRSRTNRMLGGVSGGLGEFLGIDPTVIRLLFLFAGLLGWVVPSVLTYLVLYIVIPEAPETGRMGEAGAALRRSVKQQAPPEPVGEIPLGEPGQETQTIPGPGTTSSVPPSEGLPPE